MNTEEEEEEEEDVVYLKTRGFQNTCFRFLKMKYIAEHVVPVTEEEEVDVVHLRTRVSGCRR